MILPNDWHNLFTLHNLGKYTQFIFKRKLPKRIGPQRLEKENSGKR